VAWIFEADKGGQKMRKLAWAVLAVFFWAGAGEAQDAHLPKGTLAWLQVNVPELAASPLVQPFRQAWEAAGQEAIDGFLKRLPVKPSQVKVLSGILFQPDPQVEPRGMLMIGFTGEVNAAELLRKSGLAQGLKETDGFLLLKDGDLGVVQVDPNTIGFGPPVALASFKKLPKDNSPVWEKVRKNAEAETVSAWITTDLSAFPKEMAEEIRQSVGVALDSLKGSEAAGLGIRFAGSGATARGMVLYRDEQLAQASLENWKLQTDLVKGLAQAGSALAGVAPLAGLFGDTPGLKEMFGSLGNPLTEEANGALGALAFAYYAGALSDFAEKLGKVEFKKNGLAVSVEGDIPPEKLQLGAAQSAIVVGLLLPAVQKVREAARRSASTNNLKQLGIALHNYHDANGRFPPAYVVDKAGKPLYSWRVLILPYIEQDAIYKKWKLDEAWDSPNNKPLSDLAIKVFNDPAREASNKTPYRVFYGNGAMFDAGKPGPMAGGTRLQDVTDGTSNTFMVMDAREEVPWAAPQELPFDPKKPLPPLGAPGRQLFLALMGDGSVRAIAHGLAEETLKAYITRNGGEVIPPDPR
jgi:hypothetical protein